MNAMTSVNNQIRNLQPNRPMTDRRIVRIATRPSKLAVGQTKIIIGQLQAANPDISFELVPISTLGDRDHASSLTSFGGTGVFVKELEQALLDGRADAAVHSLKDVPSGQPNGLVLASFPQRENPCDVFISRTGLSITEMPAGFILGTGSPRRVLQLLNLRPDAQQRDIRGNIDTRLAKLEAGEYDAIILARAGLNRLGIVPPGATDLDIAQCIPAIGQGCIAIECRAGDSDVYQIIRSINHAATEACVCAERAFMATVEGGCKFPLAAHAVPTVNGVLLNAIIGDLNSMRFRTKEVHLSLQTSEDDATAFAHAFKQECLAEGINCMI